jgi:predicted Zn-dependent protease with MMP-like domain
MVFPDEEFEETVNAAWDKIPARFKNEMENLSVLVEARPTFEQLGRVKTKGLLLGLFEGVPKTAWGQVGAVQPCKISIFREPILSCCNDKKDLEDTVQVVLMHEVAHYFGFNEDDLFVMDKKLRKKLSGNTDNMFPS